jgi:hypothetical protein
LKIASGSATVVLKGNKMKTQTTINRLLALADEVEKVPRKGFYYGYWYGKQDELPKVMDCGTSCCALGLAAKMRKFRKLGLVWGNQGWGGALVPEIKGTEDLGLNAASKIFGLVGNQASYVFANAEQVEPKLSKNATPKTVANHIRHFCKEFAKNPNFKTEDDGIWD